GQGVSCCVDQRPEGLGDVHGQVSEDLAVDLDLGPLEAVDEAAVGQALLPRGGVDPGDPQAPEVALALAAVPVLVPQRVHHGLVGDPVATAAGAAESASAVHDGPTRLARGDGTLDACHDGVLLGG